MTASMQDQIDSSYLNGANSNYVEALYEDYLLDQNSVSPSWQKYFSTITVSNEQNHSLIRKRFAKLAKEVPSFSNTNVDNNPTSKQLKVLQLINAYRVLGYKNATLDPLKLKEKSLLEDLQLDFYEFDNQDLETEFAIGSYVATTKPSLKLNELQKSLAKVYCSNIGFEYMHLATTKEKRWIQSKIEPTLNNNLKYSDKEKSRFLQGLMAAEGLEKYIGAKFPGAKRFSLEGGDALIPMLKELILSAGNLGTKEILIGMAHRGRLNVLVNVLGKKPSDLFDEFTGKYENNWGSGDVKYHLGFSSIFATDKTDVHLSLGFNPSHLEIVNPVIMGASRARFERKEYTDSNDVVPITIHGDSAIAGQGIVQETFNLSKTRAFGVGGSIRIVINNQIGFTTSNILDTRSTEYCTDIAKMLNAPIFHVNADDIESVIYATNLALEYRREFKKDVVIELICYRRHGHNEADEPSATQPMMYKKIKAHQTPKEIYAKKIIAQNVIAENDFSSMSNKYRESLDKGECVVDNWRPSKRKSSNWVAYLQKDWTQKYDSKTPLKKLKSLAKTISSYPSDHKIHPRVKKIYDLKQEMIQEKRKLDWGFAENLAYATVLDKKYQIRLTGQDSGRGTFFHRHAVLHSQVDGSTYVPLKNISKDQGKFDVYDSVLSEEAVLAFEFGFAATMPKSLCIWEAQFGDFANVAQVVIDQFLSTAEQKWGRLCGLTMLLPHGYEGQGPEHSSARLERFLQLCADQNMQVCVPSTPAQIYHLLRRQILRDVRKPLIVMSPKSLLRHPLAVSTMDELANGDFLNAIKDTQIKKTKNVKRVVLCSGKVYFDLFEKRKTNNIEDIALIRIEQLYPFPKDEVLKILQDFAHVKDFVWVQEEPQNQGAWYSSQHNFWSVIPSGANLNYVGRAASAAPAVGYASVHLAQQNQLVNDALLLTK